jgi:UDP-N-acetyl-D-galactosamine dehydrogenase
MNHQRRISVTGLGYVGLPVAVAFARAGAQVVAYDVDGERIGELRQGHDRTHEVDPADLRLANLTLTADADALFATDFHIVAAPTPLTDGRRPDLSQLVAATETVAGRLKRGDIVVFESTVYPGATEEVCLPALERCSGLACGGDFGIGYAPERINPGDRERRFETVAKVVAASDAATLDIVARVYGSVVVAGIHRAPSIRTAEAAKVIENTQRDLNIALMNELALICDRLGLDTHDVLDAAASKWNFLRFTPGLVGGHCIGVDPYYLTYRAEQAGYHPQVILAGRRINDGMGQWLARETVKRLLQGGAAGRLSVVILGVTFKENVPDFRNSRVIDIVHELQAFGIDVQVYDPLADPVGVRRDYGVSLSDMVALAPADAVIVAVAHDSFRQAGWDLVARLLRGGAGLVADVKGCLDRAATPPGVRLWRL